MLLTHLMDYNIEKFGEYPFLYYDTKMYTNIETSQLAQRIAQVLSSHGVNKGDRIMVCMPNCPEVIFSYQGIFKSGAIAIPVMHLLHPHEIHFMLSNSEAKAIITSSITLPKIVDAAKDLAFKPKIFVIDQWNESEKATGVDVMDLYQEMAIQDKPLKMQEIQETDVAVIIYTSGTTGNPKGVMLTHKNLYSNASNTVSLYEDDERGTTLGVLPLAHAYGLSVSHSLFLRGNSMVIFPKYDLEAVCQAIQRHRVKSFAVVPAIIHHMVMSPVTDKYDLSSLENVGSGSAPLPVAILEAFQEKFNAEVREGYGLTETSPAVSTHRKGLPIKPGSVGIPIPGVEIRVIDENGNQLPPGEIGELLVRGDNVTPGYYRNEEATRAALKDGWLHTGDIARIDEDGYLFIVDRKKDVIIRGGFNIYPRDLEELIATHEAVTEVAVVGVPSKEMGEEVVACVVKKPGKEVTEKELIEFCQDRLAKYKTPRRVLFIDQLPRNGVGKIMKKKIKEMVSYI